MAPTTGFEDSGGASWTTLAEEQAFLETVDAETPAVLTTAGVSEQARPIWRMDLGTPTSGTWLIVGNQHPDEPAGREAALLHVRNLAYSSDPGVMSYLASHRIVYVPNANPDTTEAFQHTNTNNIDINRDVYQLTQAEAQVVQAVITDTGPSILADLHERDAVQLGTQMLYRRNELVVVHSGIKSMGDDLIDELIITLNNNSISHDLYPSPGRQSLREAAGLHHAIGLLIETDMVNDTPVDRVAFQYLMLQTTRTWHEAEAANLDAMMDNSVIYQATTTDDYHLQTGNFGSPPWPGTDLPAGLLGYELTEPIPPRLTNAYDVAATATHVLLGQPARAIVPILVDEDSQDLTGDPGTRLFTLDTIPVQGSVSDFAAVVSGSHRAVFEARVLTTFQLGSDPDGTTIPILEGDVEYDATAEVFATLDLTTNGTDERGDSLFPRRAGDLLAPYGNEVFVRRGVDLGGTVLWSNLGYFRIDDVESEDPYGPIQLACSDRMAAIVEAELVRPRQFRRGATIASVVDELVTEVYPNASIVFDDDSGLASLGRNLVVEKKRYAALLDIVESLGKVMYFDGTGVLRIEDPPEPGDPLWEVKAGRNGVLVESSRSVTRDGMANGVVVIGEGGDTERPIHAVVVDDGATSPTRWGGRFGRVPKRFSSPLVTTQEQAVTAGQSLLRRHIGMPYSADFGAVPNPALRPRDPVRVWQRDGNREHHIMETVVVPLTASEPMTGTTREQTQVSVSQL